MEHDKMRGTIVVVDDEDDIVQFIQDALEDEGYTVFTAFDGAQALLVARAHHPDLMILDIMLPRRDGFAVCRELREELDIPILFLSAKQSDADKIQGFRVGADDYVLKPFSIKELMARVEAHLRRERRGQQRRDQAHSATCLNYGHLSIDLSAYEVRYAGQLLPLTLKEFEIIQLLVLHPRQVFSREVIYDRIWKMDALGDTKTVTEHIKRIRKKISHYDSRTEYISTVWGVGYKWELRTSI
ncbi:response regulator transcription factor [Ktedonospora formicarum]|uniref:DNA-binding response regulator n=1 Tax=Ktedonospora formicarum TaxID=2778364 RepID=A0A8J3MUM8_9CHLR|nr:response regulator transcription factor [Ktedonospora formicarum]GHO47081.1 DNA-binding response regulator [Ktedonospora formicarum]